MATLLVAEFAKGHLGDVTAKALTAALQMGAPVHVLVAGENCAAAAAQPWPATSICTGAPICMAAVSALAVTSPRCPLANSATSNVAIR